MYWKLSISRVTGRLETIPAITGREAGIHPGQVTSPSQDLCTHTFTPRSNLGSPISLMHLGDTGLKPTQTLGEHTSSTEQRPDLKLNPHLPCHTGMCIYPDLLGLTFTLVAGVTLSVAGGTFTLVGPDCVDAVASCAKTRHSLALVHIYHGKEKV